MHLSGHLACAAAALFLAACAQQPPSPRTAPVAAVRAAAQPVPAAVASRLTPYETMQAALPAFDLRPGGDASAPSAAISTAVSVVRDVAFAPGSSILDPAQVARLEPLQAYLRAHPRTAIHVEAAGDADNAPARAAELAWSRARAVERALTVDIGVANRFVIDEAGVLRDRASARPGHAEITFLPDYRPN